MIIELEVIMNRKRLNEEYNTFSGAGGNIAIVVIISHFPNISFQKIETYLTIKTYTY